MTSPSHCHGKRDGKCSRDVRRAGRLGGQLGVDHFLTPTSPRLPVAERLRSSGSVFTLISRQSANATRDSHLQYSQTRPLTFPGDASREWRLYPMTFLLRRKGSSHSKFPAEDGRVNMAQESNSLLRTSALGCRPNSLSSLKL